MHTSAAILIVPAALAATAPAHGPLATLPLLACGALWLVGLADAHRTAAARRADERRTERAYAGD